MKRSLSELVCARSIVLDPSDSVRIRWLSHRQNRLLLLWFMHRLLFNVGRSLCGALNRSIFFVRFMGCQSNISDSFQQSVMIKNVHHFQQTVRGDIVKFSFKYIGFVHNIQYDIDFWQRKLLCNPNRGNVPQNNVLVSS